MIQARRIGHATFETPDLDGAIDYYTQVNGLVLAEREPGRAFLAIQDRPARRPARRGVERAMHGLVVRSGAEFRLRRDEPPT